MKVLLLAPLVLALSATPAFATSATYVDFSDLTGLTLNGAAAQAGNALRLVPSADTQAGSAYLSDAVALTATTGFSTAFKFNVATDPNSAFGQPDGFTFLLQSANLNAVGMGGEGLGYVGVTPSMAVVFRGRNPNLIGVITGGTNPVDLPTPFQPAGYYSGVEGEFYNRDEFVWIDYNPIAMKLDVFLATDATKPLNPIMSTTVDVMGTVGSQTFVGFSAGNGGAYGSQDILSWSFSTTAVPEPGAAGMLALGLAALGLLRRRAVKR